jgi:hypothetical protein
MTNPVLRALAAAALLVAALTALTASPASAKTAGKCTDKAKGVTVLERTKTAVVFERKARTGSSKGELVAFGCLRKKGANVLLGPDELDSAIEEPALAGNYVAFGQSFCFGTEDLCGVTVKVVDLRTGKVVRKADAFDGSEDADVALTALALSPRGFAGWIANGDTEEEDLPYEVHALDSAGARKLDTGAKIPAKSLTLSGSTLSWKNGAATRTATLA